MDEQTFPQESLPQNQHLGPLTAEEVVNYLWREGKVPEWIDINVHSSDKSYTYLRLLCCGRYTAADQLLYHQQEGSPPFHKGSPYIPPGWESVEKNGKFDVEWMQSANKRRPNNGMQRTRNIAALLKSIFRARR
ncbi:MAG TPA: hypothetical protein VGW12_03870 [Pyrinomonadaceae bacterium]|nr:hypothetical protein [Pyrinomonadaceae bacterium]